MGNSSLNEAAWSVENSVIQIPVLNPYRHCCMFLSSHSVLFCESRCWRDWGLKLFFLLILWITGFSGCPPFCKRYIECPNTRQAATNVVLPPACPHSSVLPHFSLVHPPVSDLKDKDIPLPLSPPRARCLENECQHLYCKGFWNWVGSSLAFLCVFGSSTSPQWSLDVLQEAQSPPKSAL